MASRQQAARKFAMGALPAIKAALLPLLLPALLAGVLASTAGCGFHLRGSGQQLALPFKTVYLNVANNSALGIELARNLRGGGETEVVRERAGAQAVIEVLSENREKSILSLNFQGRVREYALTYTLRFQVKDAAGRELLAPNEILLKRTISFNESQVLAKEAEETLLYRDMQTDLVQQIIRRLATIKLQPQG